MCECKARLLDLTSSPCRMAVGENRKVPFWDWLPPYCTGIFKVFWGWTGTMSDRILQMFADLQGMWLGQQENPWGPTLRSFFLWASSLKSQPYQRHIHIYMFVSCWTIFEVAAMNNLSTDRLKPHQQCWLQFGCTRQELVEWKEP